MMRKTTARAYEDESIIRVPWVLGDEWLVWFHWHAALAGTGAILGPSRGMPEVGPRVVEALPAAPSLAGGRDEIPRARAANRWTGQPPDPGMRVRH